MGGSPGGVPEHFLQPCMIFAHRLEHQISTVLGSCVSVCLWDTRRKLGGMNHYMLPLWNGEGLPTPKYGNIAIDRLVEKVLLAGARREDLVAKVFGGARVLGSHSDTFNIGAQNSQVARELLEKAGVPILASDLEGTCGLRVLFHTGTGVVLVRRIPVTHGGS